MSVLQYARQLSVIVGKSGGAALEFKDFKLTFNIERGDKQTPNSCDLRIYNLAPATANLLAGREFDTVTVQAGYAGNYGLIFTGGIKQVRQGRIDQRDSYVDITAADGDEAYLYAVTNTTLAAGATRADAVSAFLKSFGSYGITKGYVPDFPPDGLPRGKVLYGMTRDLLRKFCRAYGYTWSIQDGAFTLIPLTSYIPGETPVISPSTGLIGVPEQTEGGICVRVLLNPTLKIGTLVKLESAVNLIRYGIENGAFLQNFNNDHSIAPSAQGLYYIMVANHSGETRGNPWYTDLTCLSVDATVVPTSLVEQSAPFPANAISRF